MEDLKIEDKDKIEGTDKEITERGDFSSKHKPIIEGVRVRMSQLSMFYKDI